MDAETVTAEENKPEEILSSPDVATGEQAAEPQVEEQKEQYVPLPTHIKERRRRQELEQENRIYREMLEKQQAPVIQEDDKKYEAITNEEFEQKKAEIIQKVREETWIENNPEKLAIINERLPEFLQQRPNLKYAIEHSANRYLEAWNLMEALNPKQKEALKQAAVTQKKAAPNSPSSVPKAAALNESINLMNMTDAEYFKWRESQKKRR